MKVAGLKLNAGLSGLDRESWLEKIEALTDDLGYFQPLGPDHFAAFIDAGKNLLVTFENAALICDQGGAAEPVGFSFVREDGWSHLAIISHDESWFRHPAIYGYFDRLVDDGFFEDFDQVLFYGAGAGGYAAAAFSVAAPGCNVLAIRPQATLDPRVAGFDPRYRHYRRSDFTSRYGYAPDMIDAASRTFVVFNPAQRLDAMHAALFARANVTTLRCGHIGPRLDLALAQMHILPEMIRRAMAQKLTEKTFSRLLRARRDYFPFQRNLLQAARREGHGALAAAYCAARIRIAPNPFFSKQMEELEAEGFKAPADSDKKAAE